MLIIHKADISVIRYYGYLRVCRRKFSFVDNYYHTMRNQSIIRFNRFDTL